MEDSREDPPIVNCSELDKPVPKEMQAGKVIYRSAPGVLVNARQPVGEGPGSQDMVNVALRIRLNTLTASHELISDETVKVWLARIYDKEYIMSHRLNFCPYVHKDLCRMLGYNRFILQCFVSP